MNPLLSLLLIAACVALVAQYAFLRHARYWRDYWSRRHDEMARELGEALSLADDKGTEAFQTNARHHAERRQVETALKRLWPRLDVQTPEEGAAVAVLRATFPSLPVPPCPKCSDSNCAAPGKCDDPEHFFGGIGP